MWRLEGEFLVAQALDKEGKSKGDVFKAPLLFTGDRKEYSEVLESGHRRATFYRLLANGQLDRHRTRLGATYPADKFGPVALQEFAAYLRTRIASKL